MLDRRRPEEALLLLMLLRRTETAARRTVVRGLVKGPALQVGRAGRQIRQPVIPPDERK